MLVVGVVGGIGTGKTEVLRLLGERGAATVAADELSRAALQVGQPAWQQVREAFGAEYFDADGELKRRTLGELIFRDDEAREQLNRLVHPFMLELLRARLREWEGRGVAVAAVEAAVLVEMGALDLMDRLILVQAPEAQVMERLQQRDQLTEAQVRRRLQTHQRLGLAEAPADFVVVNDGDPKHLADQVQRVWEQLV
jgi:dephospho-CoA kinase